jgi:uncharacterized protein (TIGR02271 family)
MPTTNDTRDWAGADLVGPEDEKLGTISQVYVDRETGEPTFASVRTGLFGMRGSLVPISEASRHGDHIHVPYTKDQVKDAPNLGDEDDLSTEDEERLYRHYGLGYGGTYDGPDHPSLGREVDTGVTRADNGAEPTAGVEVLGAGTSAGHDTSGPNTDNAMTRSEEELRVGTRSTEAGRVRLRKYVTTEQVETAVPVSHEEVTIEREPITDANLDAATDGPAISEEEHEVVLHAEEPVVEKNVVPKERVRLGTETVTEEATVRDSVRKEQIETDGDQIDRP